MIFVFSKGGLQNILSIVLLPLSRITKSPSIERIERWHCFFSKHVHRLVLPVVTSLKRKTKNGHRMTVDDGPSGTENQLGGKNE